VEALQTPTRITLRNILFTTDFSETSKAALPYALALARLYEAKVFVAHVIRPEPPLGLPMDALPAAADPAWRDGQTELAEFLSKTAWDNLAHETMLQRGELWDVVSGMVAKNDVDLLVLGTHGRHGLRKVVLGSSAEQIYRQAACPVLTVGPNVRRLGKTLWKPTTMIYATDLSATAQRALPYALSLAEENEARLIFVHALPLIPWQEQGILEQSTREELEQLMPEDAAAWCKPEFVVRFDYPAQAILDLAEQSEADLIVMGVKKPASMAWADHLPWHTASEVVSRARCPVLTVRG
jgi:nucleotide-binding universal stress UspA family protein